MTRSLLLGLLLASPPLAAQTPGTCAFGTATTRLTVGDVDARLYNNGALFLNQSTGRPEYIVPQASGGTALYAAGLWVGATVGGVPRVASARFLPDFWPGPLGADASLPNPTDCSAYDRIYTITAADVASYETSGVLAADLAAWPVGLGAEARDASGQIVVATSRSQTINLAAGERPVLAGEQTAFWVMNDVGNAHARTGSAPLGIEVQVTASAFARGALALRQSTAYRFRIVNRSAVPLESAFASFFVDTDIGSDDLPRQRQGVDVARGMAFTYNESPTATPYGVSPAVGYDFLNTGVGAHRYAINGTSMATMDALTTQSVYNTMQGLWNDGTPQTAMGTGYQTAGSVTRFAFPADPARGGSVRKSVYGPGRARSASGRARAVRSAVAASSGARASTLRPAAPTPRSTASRPPSRSVAPRGA